jgi:hypothetical protein
MGHRDTVFPDGEASRRPFTIRDGIAYGLGVADMMAGLVMNCYVLAAFAKFGGSPAPLVGLFTGDEEIGSPEGRAVIEAGARRARVVFNSEPGRLSGNVATGRKGACSWPSASPARRRTSPYGGVGKTHTTMPARGLGRITHELPSSPKPTAPPRAAGRQNPGHHRNSPSINHQLTDLAAGDTTVGSRPSSGVG